MKRAFIALISIVVLLLATVAIVPSFIDWNPYKEKIREQVKDFTGFDVEVAGDLSFAILPFPQVFLNGVTVRGDVETEKPLLTLEQLGVQVALEPLFKGKIDVAAINLVKPVVYLSLDKAGKGNWLTAKLETIMGRTEEGKESSGSAPDIALSSITIERGSVSYKAFGAEAIVVENIDTAIRADSLKGPFKVHGALSAFNENFTFKASAGKITPDAISLPVNFEVTPEAARLTLGFAGVVELGDVPAVQGNTTLRIEDAAQYLQQAGLNPSDAVSQPWLLKAFITGDAKQVNAKNLELNTGINKFSGSLDLGLNPMSAKLALAGDSSLDFAKYGFVPSSKKSAASDGGSLDLNSLQSMLPNTLVLPASMNLEAAVSAPGIVMGGQVYKGVTLQAAVKDNVFAGAFSLDEIPGKGKAQMVAELSYKGKSKEAGGSVVLSEPSLEASLSADVLNLASAAKAFGAEKSLAPVLGMKTAKMNVQLGVNSNGVQIQKSSISLGKTNAVLSGSLTYGAKGARPKVKIDASIDEFNLDQLGGDKKAGASDMQAGASPFSSFSLPFDLSFDVGAQRLTLSAQDIKGLRAKGSLIGNALDLQTLSVQSYAGVAVITKGAISDIKTLSGVDLNVIAKAPDIKSSAKALGVDLSSLPSSVKALDVSLAAKGNALKGFDVNGNLRAAGAQVIFAGKAEDILGAMKLQGLTLQVKHNNAAQFIKAFAPQFPSYASLAKPLDFYTGLTMEGGKTSLLGIKANIAGAKVTGDLSYDAGTKPASLVGKLALGRLNISGAKSSGANSNSKSKPKSTNARWSSEAIGSEWLYGMNVNIDIEAEHITYESWEMEKPSLSVVMKDGSLNINKLQAGLYGGRLAVTGSVSGGNSKNAPLGIESKLDFANVDIEKLVRSFAGTQLIKGKGRVTLDMALKSSGVSQAAIINSLGGSGTIKGADIVLEGIDLASFAQALSDDAKPGASLLGLWQGVGSRGSTSFKDLDGLFSISKGIVGITKLNLIGDQAVIETTGNIDLPKWWLDTDHKITLPQKADVPSFTMEFKGPLDNPAQTFAGGALENYLQRKITRKLQKVLSDKLNIPGLGGGAAEPQGAAGTAQQPSPQQQQINPEDALKSILQGILR